MNGNRNNNAESIFGDKYIRIATMKKEGELGLLPNQLLMVCATPEGFFQLYA